MNRAGPHFLIVGAQKAGTTSLLSALEHHPDVWVPPQKELHFFDLNWERGVAWYENLFESGAGARVCGESTPYYLGHPRAAERVWSYRRDMKLIVLLRDPVERAVAHYHHAVRQGFESLSLAEALAVEPDRLRGEHARLCRDPRARSFAHQHHSYRSRGFYFDQLTVWMEHFSRDQLLVLDLGELVRHPLAGLNRCQAFLGLNPQPLVFPRLNAGSYPPLDIDLSWLALDYQNANRKLQDWLGGRLSWLEPNFQPVHWGRAFHPPSGNGDELSKY
jgi:hypothetical protein